MYVSQRSPNTTSLVRSKTKKPEKAASAVAASSERKAGAAEIETNREAWADALSSMSSVRTPDPITALAKVAGMGMAGYMQGKAARAKDAMTPRERNIIAGTLSGEAFDEMPMEAVAMPPEEFTPLPGEEQDYDPYSDEINRAIAEAEGQSWEPRQHPLLGNRIGMQDHSMLDHQLDGTARQVIEGRPIPGTDQYGEIMTGQPYDMAPQQPAVPRPVPRPEMPEEDPSGVSPISYSPGAPDAVQVRRAPGRFGGLSPASSQASGVQRVASEGDAAKPAGPKKLTEAQSKDVNFYNRGIYANDELTAMESALQQPIDAAASNLPFIGGVVGPFITDEDYKRADRAAREFLAIVLRKDTGAQVTNQELAMYGPMYIPGYNDGEDALAAKRAARQRFLDGLYYGSGEARSVFDEINTKFENSKRVRKFNPQTGKIE